MFDKGQWIVYGNTGVCRVEDIETPENIPTQEGKLYYKLTPLYDAGAIYIPVDSKMFMRPILTKEEADKLLEEIPALLESADGEESQNLLDNAYQDCMQSHLCKNWLRLLIAIEKKERMLELDGRKIRKVCQKYEKRAQELLFGELSVVWDRPYEKVQAFMKEKLEEAISA